MLARVNKVVVAPATSDLLVQCFKNWVWPNLPAPVFAVSKIAFHAMHDPVPVTSLGRVNILADRMGSIEKIVQQPKARQAALGHAVIYDAGIENVSGPHAAQFF